MLQVLLTNDDGIRAAGLRALHRRLLDLGYVRTEIIAPDSDRSGTAGAITAGRPIPVTCMQLDSRSRAHAVDGTPVDCVRLGRMGLIDGFSPEIVISGINHGVNLGRNIAYSGTFWSAAEAAARGLIGIAVSQEIHFTQDRRGDPGLECFEAAAEFVVSLVEIVSREGSDLLPSRLLNVNVPYRTPRGARLGHLGGWRPGENCDVLVDDRIITLKAPSADTQTMPTAGRTDKQLLEEGLIAVSALPSQSYETLSRRDCPGNHGLGRLRRPGADSEVHLGLEEGR